MAGTKRLRVTDEGIANLCAAILDAKPEKIAPPSEPTADDIGGQDIFTALAPVAFLTRTTVEGRQIAVTDFVKRIQDGNTQMCITDQALGAANLPTGPIA